MAESPAARFQIESDQVVGREDGFLAIRRLRLRNLRDDGSLSEPYLCDFVIRPFGLDAVVVAVWHRRPDGTVAVLVRDGLRPALTFGRDSARAAIPDRRAYHRLTELVAGVIEDGDRGPAGVLARAAAEVHEEAGFRVDAAAVRMLGAGTFPTPGSMAEKFHFAAVEVDPARQESLVGDGSPMEEGATVRWMDLEAAIAACERGEIEDAKTELGLRRLRDHLATTAPAPGPAPGAAADPPALAAFVRKSLVLSILGTERVEARRNLRYAGGPADSRKMTVYRPPGATEPRPAVVFVHGGPLPPGLVTPPSAWGQFEGYGRIAAATGMVGVTFDHRYLGYDRLLDARADVEAAVAHVRGHAAELGVDPDRIALWVASGGGPLVSGFLGDPPPYLAALVAFYAVGDLRGARAAIPPSVSDATLRDLSPAYQVSIAPRVLPMLVARAGRDNPMINRTVDALVKAATDRGVPPELIEHPTGQHSFDVLDDDDVSRAIISRAFDFLRAQLA